MKNITPGRGLDDIIFGLKRSEVFNIQGEPTETEHVDGDEESGAMEVWHYDELHLSLSFEEDRNTSYSIHYTKLYDPIVDINGFQNR